MSGENVQVIKVVPKDDEKLEDTIRRAWEFYKDEIITVEDKTINVYRNTSGLFNAELQNMEDKMDLEELRKLLKEKKQLIIFRDSNGGRHILAKTESNRLIFERLKKMKQDGVRFSMKHKMKNLTLKDILKFKKFVKSKKEKDDEISFPLQDTDGTEEIIRNLGPLQIGMEKQSNPPPRYPQFDSYDERITTFIHWPLPSINPTDLAAAGFVYTNQEDLVRCFQCGIGLNDFPARVDPLLEHVRHSGNCSFLSGLLGEDTLSAMKEQMYTEESEYNRETQFSSIKNPSLQTLESRLKTYARWPSSHPKKPQELAEAGLYYTGTEDAVRCFACDVGLRRWDPEDDPWIEHCRWFPQCPYCVEQKGIQYITLIQALDELDKTEMRGDTTANEGPSTILNTALYNERKSVLKDMGFRKGEVQNAFINLAEKGITTPTIDDFLDLLLSARQERQGEAECLRQSTTYDTNSPLHETTLLKRYLVCARCHENQVNVLFLPCAHHIVCNDCSEYLIVCPSCDKAIREKVRTNMPS